jgi:hypothetical protein
VAEPLRPQCTHHRSLAYAGRANVGFCDISRSEPTHSRHSARPDVKSAIEGAAVTHGPSRILFIYSCASPYRIPSWSSIAANGTSPISNTAPISIA